MHRLLEDANRIVTGPRQEAYGHPRDNHARTAAMWTAYLQMSKRGPEIKISEEDVCMLNILQKISRYAHSPKRDSLVDIVGWAVNVEMVRDPSDGE